MRIEPSRACCGARILGLDLSRDLRDDQIRAIRRAWLAHQVIAFPDQALAIEDIERFASAMGPDGDDPYIKPIPEHPRVIAVNREANETSPIFAESWHSDWSFLEKPPAGTVLYGMVIPPVGGDTLFSNQYAAYEALPRPLQKQIEGRFAIHSARRGYARDGLYGEKDQGRTMAIVHSDRALGTQRHPIVRVHPETGRKALFVSPGYTIGIEDMASEEAARLLTELYRHQIEACFVYRHRWTAGLLTLWDNRCLIHAATGGYQGHRRLLYRVTVAEQPAKTRQG